MSQPSGIGPLCSSYENLMYKYMLKYLRANLPIASWQPLRHSIASTCLSSQLSKT